MKAIITGSVMRKNSFYPLLPAYMDCPNNHLEIEAGTTKGPGVFFVKCILLGTKWDAGYVLDGMFCDKLKNTISSMQQDLSIEVDGNFGQETRQNLAKVLGTNLDDIPYSLLAMSDTALQPDGQSIS